MQTVSCGHYDVTWLGPDDQVGGGDDQSIPLSAGAEPVVYSPGSNVDIGSENTYPTAVRQTVTLLFDSPLPVGSSGFYRKPWQGFYNSELFDLVKAWATPDCERFGYAGQM